jgi:hypothetical protein
MGEKGMESPAPVRSGLAGAAEAMAPMPGVSNMAGGGALAGAMGSALPQGTVGGVGGSGGDTGSNEAAQQNDDMIRRPPTG